MTFSIKGPPPPRDAASRAKARCSTLPPRPGGPDPGHIVPRPRHSNSMTFSQETAISPLSPQPAISPLSPQPAIPPYVQSPTSVISPSFVQSPSLVKTPPSVQSPPAVQSPSSVQSSAFIQSPPANPEFSPSELFLLKGPPLRETTSRAKGRCSTLPARPRGPGAGESAARPSHSTSFTKLEGRIPPSLSQLKRDSQV